MAATGEYGSSARMMVSYGGEIVHGDHGQDGKAAAAAPYYAGGVHRIVKVGLSERLADLRQRMAALAGSCDVCIRYALPGEGLGRLRDVANDGDLWGLVSLLFCHEASKTGRVRVFLFGVDAPPLRSASAPSLPALLEDGGDTTTAASGGACAAPITLGLRSGSSPSLATSGTAVRMKVSYGGEIIIQQRDGSAAASCYYAGGVHRIVRVGLSEPLADVRARLAALAGCSDVRIRYAFPGEPEGLGHLRDVASDGDLWSLVSLLFFHEAVTTSSNKPKQGRIRVFLFGTDDAPAAPPLRRSASSPSLVDGAMLQGALPALAEEEDMDIDTAAATSPAGGATGARPVSVTRTEGMRRSASSPALAMPPPSSLDSGTAATSSSSGDGAAQFAPVVRVPLIPVYPLFTCCFPVRKIYFERHLDLDLTSDNYVRSTSSVIDMHASSFCY